MRQTLARPADAERNPRACVAERNRCASGTPAPILSFAVALHQSSGWLTDGARRTSAARSPVHEFRGAPQFANEPRDGRTTILREHGGAPIGTKSAGWNRVANTGWLTPARS